MDPGFGFLKNRSDSKVQFCQESPEIPEGGRLRFFLDNWKKITNDQWVLSVIEEGYKLEFSGHPPQTGIKQNSVQRENLNILETEVEDLLRKDAVEMVPLQEINCVFFFLQHIFPFSQEKRKDETCYQSETPKQVSSEDSFQDGHTVKSSQSSKAKRLGDITRSQRCVSTCADILEAQKVSPFLCKQKVLPIQSSMFWSNICTKGVYQNSGSCSSTFKGTERKTSILSRRLVSSEPNKEISVTRSSQMPDSFDFTRFYSEHREVQSRTIPDNNIHRGVVSSGPRISVSNSRNSAEITVSSRQFEQNEQSNCQ